jgi:RNA polymerase sigma-70 factor (ECF subfamily)
MSMRDPTPLAPEPGELVQRLMAGDQSAFEIIFRTHYAKLANYAKQLVRSPDAAEDVVQEVFVTLWAHRERLTAPDNLVAYLFRSVRNRGLNFLRQQRQVSTWQARQATIEPAESPAADQDAEHDEVDRAIKGAAASLSPRCREVFELSRDRGLTYRQIGETLGISIKTVETLMGRALKAIRIKLGGLHPSRSGRASPRNAPDPR